MNLKAIIFNKNSWKVKHLLLSILFVIGLLFTWFFTLTHPLWEKADFTFYRWVSSFIETSTFWQSFWAISNHNLADWFHDVIMIAFFAAYFIKKTDKSLSCKISEMIFFSLLIGLTIILINRHLCLDVLEIHRKSPSLICDFGVDLSKKLSWIRVKGHSVTSYPGDHGTTAIMFAMCIWHLMGAKAGLIAFLYSIYWIMPRLVTGCHWLTDVIMGSLAISIFITSLAIYTPLKQSFVHLLSKLLDKQNLKNLRLR